MAGHSRWAQIKHKKALSDAKRGQLFSKIVREIIVAAREGGGSAETNPRLRAALERGREAGLPKENAVRALERATGKGEEATLQEFLYEVIGPGGAHILIDGITDNNNRTLTEIRQIVSRHNAKLVPAGSLVWNFEKTWTKDGKNYQPKTSLELSNEDQKKIMPLLDELIDHSDVQEVYTNLTPDI